MNTKLSIVVSVFNKAHYLESFLWAIRQLQPGAELVLVDDGSNDGAANICKRHADIFVQTDNAWETKANNAGLRKATGDIVAIVQDDDVPLSSHWLKRMADIMHLRSIDVLSGRGTSVNYYYSDIEEPLSASYMQRAFAGCRIDESISKMPRSSLWKQLLKIIPGDGRNYSRAAEYIDQRDLLALNEIDWRPRPIVYGG